MLSIPGFQSLIACKAASSFLIRPRYRFHQYAFFAFVLCALLPCSTVMVRAQEQRAEYRAFWVDTFNTPLNNHNDIVAVVNNAKAAKANAIFAQVRRRGDSWYLNSLEPPPDFTPIAANFDPLQDLIAEAHASGIEVHAFVIIGAIWNKNPTFAPSATLGPPTNSNHVFNRHGGYDPVTKKIVPGPNNWLTRTLLPDGAGGVSFQGHRIGNDFWIDLGHPEAAEHTFKVLMNLVNKYEIDGLHLDRIRYPEIGVGGQTPATGASTGYNETSVMRFQRRYGIAAGSPPPAQNDMLWTQWRRDQVSNLVRRVYLNAIAVKPELKLSAALIAFGGGPTTEESWKSAEAFWRVYQDWRSWTEEGILDIAIPMNYKREHTASNVTQYNSWNEWTKNHQYDRSAMIGQGAFLNSIEGTLRQTRRALAPSAAGNSASGVIFFSMANPDVAVTANPLSIPPGQNTPFRRIAEFAAGLTTGKSVNGSILYEDAAANPMPVFGQPAAIPEMAWKKSPQVGYLKGIVKDETGAIVDAGDIVISRDEDGSSPPAGRRVVNTSTDGSGFFGGVDLAPGRYRVTVAPAREAPFTTRCTVEVAPGKVSDFVVVIDRTAPTASINADPSSFWPPNGKMVPVTITGAAGDTGTGIASVVFRVIDEYGRVQPVIAPVEDDNAMNMTWTRTIEIEAARDGQDRDGRVYTIEAIVTDRACNQTIVTTTVTIAHDQRK